MLPIVHEMRRLHENLQFKRHRRRLRREFNVGQIPDARFKELFRISKEMYAELCDFLMPYVPEPRYANRDIDLAMKLLVTLRFYATGAYQRTIGGDFTLGVSQTSVHR